MSVRLELMGRRIYITPPLLFGAVMVAFGLSLLWLGFSAQLDIDSIGATTDPALQERVSQLESERDVYILTAAGTLFIGLFSAFILAEKNMSVVVPESQMLSSAKASRDILAGLSLAGNAAYLPAKHGLTQEKVFIPATNSTISPPAVMSDALTISPGKDGSTPGLLIEPLGKRLLDNISKDLQLDFADTDMEFVEGGLQTLKHGLGMIRDFHFKEREGRTVLRVEYSGFSEACATIRKQWPDTCRQLSCTGCSCLLTALSRATGRIVRVDEVDNEGDTVVFSLSLLDW